MEVGIGEVEVVTEGIEGPLVEEVLQLGVLELVQERRAGGGDVFFGGGMINVLGGEGIWRGRVSAGSSRISDDTHIRMGFHPSPAGGASSFRNDWLAPDVLWPTWVLLEKIFGGRSGVDVGQAAG